MRRRLPPTILSLLLAGCGSEGSPAVSREPDAGKGGAAGAASDATVGAGATSSGGADAASFDTTQRDASLDAAGSGVPGGPDGNAGRDASGARSVPTFRKITLTTAFYAEGANAGDFDRNGTTDVVSGPYWYEGPAFTRKHVIYAPVAFDPKSYSNAFLEFVRDFDGDDFPDVLVVNYPGRDASVYTNSRAPDVPWVRHIVVSAVDEESPAFTDLTGDGIPELVFASQNRIGWAGPAPANPYEPWVFHAATPVGSYPTFTHGLGVGDVDGDGRRDLLEAGGVWKQPTNLAGDPQWTETVQSFGSGGAQMFAVDVDGDGDADVVTSLAAHEYGIAWFEQRRSAGTPAFARHLIATDDPADAGAGALIFQPHALDVADMDGDGLPDIVTGERFWAHVPAGNPDPDGPAKLYWFALVRDDHGARFTPHLIDDASGVGTQVVTADVNDDGRLDIVTASKKGAFVFIQE